MTVHATNARELLEQRDTLLENMEAIVQRAEAENRNLDPEESNWFNRYAGDIKAIDSRLNLRETMNRLRDPAMPKGELRDVKEGTGGFFSNLLASGVLQRVFNVGGSSSGSFVSTIRALLGTSLAPATTALGPVNVAPQPTRLIGLIPTIPAEGNSISFTRLSYTTNSAAQAAEGTAKGLSVLSPVPVTLDLNTYAHYVPVAKQGLSDHNGMQAVVNNLLVAGLIEKVSAAIYAAMTTVGNYSAFTPTASEPVGDSCARAAATLLNAGATGVTIVINPTQALAGQLQKASTSGVYLGLPPNLNAAIVASPDVAANKLVAFSSDAHVWADRENVSVVAGLNADDFTKNLVTLLCELRGAYLPLNPGRILYGPATA